MAVVVVAVAVMTVVVVAVVTVLVPVLSLQLSSRNCAPPVSKDVKLRQARGAAVFGKGTSRDGHSLALILESFESAGCSASCRIANSISWQPRPFAIWSAIVQSGST